MSELRDKIAGILFKHMCGLDGWESDTTGRCTAEDCTFEGHQAMGLNGFVGPDEWELQAGHQADLLMPLIREAEAAAWSAGVATALNHAILNDDEITLRLEHLDGRPWANPYESDDQ